jgi:hypothetical protein
MIIYYSFLKDYSYLKMAASPDQSSSVTKIGAEQTALATAALRAVPAGETITKTFENNKYCNLMNDVGNHIYHLYDHHKGFIQQTAAKPTNCDHLYAGVGLGHDTDDQEKNESEAEEIEEAEDEEEDELIEVNYFCNFCGENWTEEEESELSFHFYPCGHVFHRQCFGKYLLTKFSTNASANSPAITLNWLENSATRLEIQLTVNTVRLNENVKCPICTYFEEEYVSEKKYPPDAILQCIYHQNTQIGKRDIVYFREQDIDQLEKDFELGDIISFIESPNELYILELNKQQQPCFKKCTDNIIPYHFLQMQGYLFYLNSIYLELITEVPLDNQENEYWDTFNCTITHRESYDNDDETVPEREEYEEDIEVGLLSIGEDSKLYVMTDNKVNEVVPNNMLPMNFIHFKGYQYYYDWALANQYPLQLIISTFEVIDVLNHEIRQMSGLYIRE